MAANTCIRPASKLNIQNPMNGRDGDCNEESKMREHDLVTSLVIVNCVTTFPFVAVFICWFGTSNIFLHSSICSPPICYHASNSVRNKNCMSWSTLHHEKNGLFIYLNYVNSHLLCIVDVVFHWSFRLRDASDFDSKCCTEPESAQPETCHLIGTIKFLWII